MPITSARALPEVSLPADFELHCPGGLSALAVKTRALMIDGRQCSSSDAPRATAPGETEQPGVRSEEPSTPDGHGGASKRQRCGDAASSSSDSGGLLGLDDHAVGTAAAIAVFGWQCVATVVVASPPKAGHGAVGAGEETSRRLRCTVCNRRVVTDNFLTVDMGGVASSPSGVDRTMDAAGMNTPAGGPSGKRRRLSGGGTPLKAMDLAAEHRSFCPWAVVHPAVEGEGWFSFTGCSKTCWGGGPGEMLSVMTVVVLLDDLDSNVLWLTCKRFWTAFSVECCAAREFGQHY